MHKGLAPATVPIEDTNTEMHMEQTITHRPVRSRLAAAAVGAVMLAGLGLSVLAAGPATHDLAAAKITVKSTVTGGKTTVVTSLTSSQEDVTGTRWR